jgi:nicotinate-nucleotide adenylyltransferase
LIAKKYPEADITPIIGGDSLRELPTWNRPQELLQASHWVGVMQRPGEQENLEALERQLPGISSKVHYVDAPLLEIASREIGAASQTGNLSATTCTPRCTNTSSNITSISNLKSKSKSEIVNPKS